MKFTHTAIATGNSRLTIGDLADFVKNIPREATAVVTAKPPLDQMDNHRWTIQAEWDEVADKNWKGQQR